MAKRSLVLVGAPDSGKTNYLARLWSAVGGADGTLCAKHIPQDIRYVDQALEYLLRGEFAPRTEVSDRGGRSFSVVVERKDSEEAVDVIVPDVSGELWREAVESYELPAEWMRKLEQSVGALLFVRIGSDQNVAQLDWVAWARLLGADVQNDERRAIPTAVQLCELVRFLEGALGKAYPNRRARVAVLVTAWDRLNSEEAAAGPRAFLEREYPLFAGRIAHSERVDVAVFGVSVVGGDFADPNFRQEFMTDGHIGGRGCVVSERGGKIEETKDLTMPVDWVLSSEDGQ